MGPSFARSPGARCVSGCLAGGAAVGTGLAPWGTTRVIGLLSLLTQRSNSPVCQTTYQNSEISGGFTEYASGSDT